MATATIVQEVFDARVRDRAHIPLACLTAAMLAYVVIPRVQLPSLRPSFDLTVRQDGAQMLITWNRWATRMGANLEILDGEQHTSLFVPAGLANLTYQARSSDVEVRLGHLADPARAEIARCLVREPESIAVLDRQMTAATAEAQGLRLVFEQRSRRVDRLQRQASRLLVSRPAARNAPKAKATTWWR